MLKQLDQLGDLVSNILMSIKSLYVRLVGFGKNDQELVVYDIGRSGKFNTAHYYSYDLQTKSLKELVNFPLPKEKGLY